MDDELLLRNWYLARLRKLAVEQQQEFTPSTLLNADRTTLQTLRTEHSRQRSSASLTQIETPLAFAMYALTCGTLISAAAYALLFL